MASADAVGEEIKKLWTSATSIEPAAGRATRDDVAQLRSGLDTAASDVAALHDEDLDNAYAGVLARCAVVAFAAGDTQAAHDWLQAAQRATHDPDLKALFEVAMRNPASYRALV